MWGYARRLLHTTMAQVLAPQAEVAFINVNKPYRPRKLKTDPAHRLARRMYHLKSLNPSFRRKANLYRKKYLRRNGRALDKRSDFVSRIRKQRGLD